MSVGLITWGRFFDAKGSRVTVPAPSTEPDAPWLWDFLCNQLQNIGEVGFTHIQLPPASKVQGGAGAGCDGYEVFDPRDIGSKNQQNSIPTRYGTADSLKKLVAMAHANGVNVLLDVVLHQLGGAANKTYKYLGSDGKTFNGRGPMTPTCFSPPQPYDDVPAPQYNEGFYAFGDEKTYQHSLPAGYTVTDALDYGNWLFRTTGADGGRYDDTKGAWPQFVSKFMNSNEMATKQWYSEYDDGNPGTVNWWATSWPMNSRSEASDFTLHYRIQAACNSFNAQQLIAGDYGFAQWNPSLAYGFVDNPDTDTSPGQQVMFNKLLGYAWMLSLPMKMALIYGKDYYPSSIWPGAYGLNPWIDNMIWVNRTFAFGAAVIRWCDQNVIVLSRDGNGGASGWSGGLLTCLNFDTMNSHTVTVQTTFGGNRHLHDYAGHGPDVWTDGFGQVTITVPSNAYSGGESYLFYAPSGVTSPIQRTERSITQSIYGAADLDLPPARNLTRFLNKIYCEKNKAISLKLIADRTGWNGNSNLQVQLVAPNGTPAVGCVLPITGTAKGESVTTQSGLHTLKMTGNFLPVLGSSYELEVTYTAPQR
jgi:alpha-amylase